MSRPLQDQQDDPASSLHQNHLWRMRWYLIVVLSSWTALSIIAPIIVFFLTRNSLSLSLFTTLAPPIYLWYRFVRYLLPLSENDFRLEMEKLSARKDTLNLWRSSKRSNH